MQLYRAGIPPDLLTTEVDGDEAENVDNRDPMTVIHSSLYQPAEESAI